MKRSRGRPHKFRGDKDRRVDFPAQLSEMVYPVIDFIVAWQDGKAAATKRRGADRRQEALEAIAKKYNISTRTLERRYADKRIRMLAEPIAQAALYGQTVVQVEYIPRD